MNTDFGRVDDGIIVFAPDIIRIVIHHDADTTSNWDEIRTIVNPSAEEYLLSDPQYKYIVMDMPTPGPWQAVIEDAPIETDTEIIRQYHLETITPSLEDFNQAMESHLKTERSARGYTDREPSDYLTSTVERWRQDAKDWVAHRDEVMLYGLGEINKYQETGIAPTMDEFCAGLPRITWTVEV